MTQPRSLQSHLIIQYSFSMPLLLMPHLTLCFLYCYTVCTCFSLILALFFLHKHTYIFIISHLFITVTKYLRKKAYRGTGLFCLSVKGFNMTEGWGRTNLPTSRQRGRVGVGEAERRGMVKDMPQWTTSSNWTPPPNSPLSSELLNGFSYWWS